MLFNTASLQSQIAKFQNFDSDEGLKNAAKHFQVRIVHACNVLFCSFSNNSSWYIVLVVVLW